MRKVPLRKQLFGVLLLGLISSALPFSVGCGGGAASSANSSGGSGNSGGGSPSPTPSPATSPHPSIRTRYLRTDLQYDSNSLQFFPPHFTVYDSLHKRYFMSNTTRNRIDVFDAQAESQIGSIILSTPFGLDISSDNTKLYVATAFGDVYLVDPAAMTIVQRYPSASIGPTGYMANQAFVLGDGRVALQGIYQTVDGSPNFAVWDPASNSLTTIRPQGFGSIGAMALSRDRTKVMIASADSDEAVMVYDSVTGLISTENRPLGGIISQILSSADGTRIFLTGENGTVHVLNASSLDTLGTFSFPSGLYGAVLSNDGQTLYGVNFFGDLLAYDTSTYAQKGWVSNFDVFDLQSVIVPSAMDDSGLIFGPIGHGVAFVDGAQIHASGTDIYFNLDNGTFPGIGFVSPNTGPSNGGTTIQESLNDVSKVPASASVFFGNGDAQNVTFPSASQMNAVTPPSSFQGPADFTILFSDNSLALMPENFSFGPSIVEVSTSVSTAEGGGQGLVFGYGFGQQPSDFHISVGGQPAIVTAFTPSATPFIPYPFPMEAALFSIPSGAVGSNADITLANPNGLATATAALHYTAPLRSSPLPASALSAGVYDPHRRVLYFADQNQIQVFSPATSTWESPIRISSPGSGGRLWALALSPDGNTLAISDATQGNIYTVNPDNPGAVNSFHVQQDQAAGDEPCGLAVTNSGVVYYAGFQTGGTGFSALHKLDTSTGIITNLGTTNGNGIQDLGEPSEPFTRVLISPDGSKIYLNLDGFAYIVDTSDDTISHNQALQQLADPTGAADLTLSGDGTTLVVSGFITDADLSPFALVTYVDRDIWVPYGVFGQKLSIDGRLVFQPFSGGINGIDLIDGATGMLLNRVVFAPAIASAFDALVIDPNDNLLFVITAEGISQLDLGSLPAMPPASQRLSTILLPHGSYHTSPLTTSPQERINVMHRTAKRNIFSPAIRLHSKPISVAPESLLHGQ